MRPIDADVLKEIISGNSYILSDSINSKNFGMFWDGIEQAIDEAPTIDVVPRWISCDERLPELDEMCLVTEKDGSIRHCYFDSADPVLFATVEEGMYVRNVVAWMPLPEPYEEVEE